jgi:AIR synthase-related protein
VGELQTLVERLRISQALARKKSIHATLQAFHDVWNFGSTLDPIGDDAAIIVTGEGYLLMSCDSIIPRLVQEEPYWAGYCAVLVSVSDIYAMGGRPMAVVNLLSAPDSEFAEKIVLGMAEGCRKLGVPMVGGHFLPDELPGVSTAILGRASHVLRGTKGTVGQSLIAAVDLEGKPHKHYLQWDCTSFRTPEQLRSRFEVLPNLAERHLATAARDISNAGIIGTLAMLAENSGLGARVHLGRVPKPPTVPMERWLQMFPGYGFIVAADPEHAGEVVHLFEQQGITAAVIGELTEDSRVIIHDQGEKAVLLDWSMESLVVGRHGHERQTG